MFMQKKRRLFRKRSPWGPACAMLVLGMTALAACAPRTELWSPAESPKRATISWAEFHHSVRYAGSTAEPSKAEREALLRFLGRVGKGQGVRIYLASASNVDMRLALRRETALADFIRNAGLEASLGPADAKGTAPANSVRVTIGRYVSRAPACPDWSKPANGDRANRVTSNFGCATMTNLSVMVADPGVLVRGTDLGPADGEAAAVGVGNYRKGKEDKAEAISPLAITKGAGR